MERLYPIICVLSCLIAAHSFAGSATWSANPVSGDWNTAANWMPTTVPNGAADTATFDISNTTAVSLSADTEVDSILFEPGASAFTVIVPISVTFSISGSGLLNNSALMQNLVTAQGTIEFSQGASAGSVVSITNEGGFAAAIAGLTMFTGSATAESAIVINNGSSNTALGGRAEFFEQSSAGSAIFINNGATGPFSLGGSTTFSDSATAAEGTFIVNGGTASAALAAQVIFKGNSSAGNGTFTINGPGVDGANGGGLVAFNENSSAGEATFTVNDQGRLSVNSASTSGNATVIANGGPRGGAYISLRDSSRGGTSRFQLFENATLDISLHFPPGIAIGSLEGDGQVLLGRQQLTVGTNNLSTAFSGVIGNKGKLAKVGTGTLTLSGANIYTGLTTVSAGMLRVQNTTGSATGSGPVQISGGLLGGKGIIAGSTTIGTGSGSASFLQPGKGASNSTTLTMQDILTLKSDSTYVWKLNTNKVKADKIVANGVSIESGAQFSLTTVANKKLTAGKVFTALSNTSVTPISGTFANLPDGSTITVGVNKLQTSYSGGDGNDLTLTVVP